MLLAEVQLALEEAVAEVTGLEGYELKRVMRTGTVATIDNRNWELSHQSGPVKRLSQSRAIALDMESATIAANAAELNLVPSKQGRVARGVQLNGAEITGIGFSLSLYSADGKPNPSFGAGPFRLHVHGVREVRDDGIESRVS